MKRYEITLKSIKHLGDDYYEFTFGRPEDLLFIEGQYGIFLHVNKEVEGRTMRAFSFASARDDEDLVIATKITNEPSSFKQFMKSLKPGDTMTVDGPMGRFTLDATNHAVFIAGGIGITPFRSLALGNKDFDHDLALIYSEANGTYPFKEDLELVPFGVKEFCAGVEETKQRIASLALTYQNEAVYYIAGSPSFIKGVMEQLGELGIRPELLKFDRFTGY